MSGVRTDRTRLDMIACWASLVPAGVLFGMVFLNPLLGFWTQLALTTAVLAVVGWVLGRGMIGYEFRKCSRRLGGSVAIGVIAAALLYLVFFVGNILVSRLFAGGASQVASVYDMGEGTPGWHIGLTLLLVVGPCEEIYWRGYLQHRMEGAYGWKGVVITIAAYTLVHLVVGNPVLLLAALVCGLYWSLLLVVFDDMVINIVSHGLWAAAIFAWLPLA